MSSTAVRIGDRLSSRLPVRPVKKYIFVLPILQLKNKNLRADEVKNLVQFESGGLQLCLDLN